MPGLTADQKEVSTVVDDAFMKGWNADEAGSSVVSSAAVTVAESQVTQAASVAETVAGTSASSAAGTQAASASGSVAGSVAASSAAASVVDWEQKWKSGNGIIKSQSLALSRANSENESLRASVTKSSQDTQAASAAVSTVKMLDELEEKYMDAFTEGDKAAALKIRKEIDGIKENQIRSSIEKGVEAKTAATLTAKDEETLVNQLVSHTYEKYPYLNNKAEERNEDAIRFVRATAADLMEMGQSKPEAISNAVSRAVPIFGSPVSQAASVAATAATSQVDEDKLKGMAAVDSKGRPIKSDQKAEGKGTFAAGWSKEE